jgi:hypothetical protein
VHTGATLSKQANKVKQQGEDNPPLQKKNTQTAQKQLKSQQEEAEGDTTGSKVN